MDIVYLERKREMIGKYIDVGLRSELSNHSTIRYHWKGVKYPFLRFRFKDKDKNDVIYNKIGDTVRDFKGLLTWEMITFNEVPNHLILPTYVYSDGKPTSGDLNEHLIAKYGENLYRQKIDQAIDDIPNLTKAIRDKFHEQ